MTEHLNIRNLQHYDGKLVYKNFYIMYEHYDTGVLWGARSINENNKMIEYTLEGLLDKIDDIVNF